MTRMQKVFQSPTFMTWGSLAARSLSILLVVPLVLRHFNLEDVSLWYLFSSALIVQNLSYVGFGSTFVRLFSYARSGAPLDQLSQRGSLAQPASNMLETNQSAFQAIADYMNFMYIRLALVLLVFSTVLTAFIIQPIELSSNPSLNAWAWGIVVFGSIVGLIGNRFTVALEGINEVALVRKWDTIFGIFGVCSNLLVLQFTHELFYLVLSTQFWLIANVPRNFVLLRRKLTGIHWRSINKIKEVHEAAWIPAIRSVIGTTASMGTYHLSNFVIAQVSSSASFASFLFGANIIRQIDTFSRAPFYSQLPQFASKYREGNMAALVASARKSMVMTYGLFTLGVFTLWAIGDEVFELIGSQTPFPSSLIWFVFAFGILLERFSSMHIQLYSTTNHILWHKTNGGFGLLYIFFLYLTIPHLQELAIPVSLVLANAIFSSWYSAKHSYALLGTRFFTFEKDLFIPFVLLYLGTIAAVLWRSGFKVC